MAGKIRVALLGLGRVGQQFAEHLLEKIQEGRKPIEIVAVSDRHPDSPVALGFAQNGVSVFNDAREVIKLGDKVDIIFDLTGDSKLRQELRLGLVQSQNHHTVIATEIFAQLLWYFFDETEALPRHAQVGY